MNKKILIIIGVIVIIGVILGVSINRSKDENTFILGMDDSFPPMGYRNENNELVVNDNPMELNLVYVAVTRAKKYIDCVNLKLFFLTVTDEELKFR